MSFPIAIVAFVASLLWELVEARTDVLAQNETRIAARKSLGFCVLVALIAVLLGAFWGYLLGGGNAEDATSLSLDRPANGLILASFFSGFGSIPALKSFKLLPIVNKVIGKISFEDTPIAGGRGPVGLFRLWWSL